MGSCLSSFSSKANWTAKLILDDGGLREFAEPVRVGKVIADWDGFFICDADSMSIDGYLCPLSADEELELGQIYFLIPSKMLRYPLSASEMAAMAIKAIAAMKSRGRRRRKLCKIRPVVEDNLGFVCRVRTSKSLPNDPKKGAVNTDLVFEFEESKNGVVKSRGRKTWKSTLSTIEEFEER